MANAASSGFKVYVNSESVWGTGVAAGAYALRLTGGVGRSTTESTMSKEVTNYENTDVVRTKVGGGGTYNFELSFATPDKEFDLLLGSIMGSAFDTDVMKVSNLRKSLTFEEKYGDITQYRLFEGALVNSLRIEIRPGDMITGSVGFTSKPETVSATPFFTTPSAANTNPVMNPLDSIQTLTWNANPILGATAFTMELRRTGIEFPQLSSIDVADIQPGSFEASGTVSLYFADATYLSDYLAFTERALAIKLGGASDKSYLFNFAKVNFSDGGIESVSKDSPIIQTFNWAAKYDSTDTTLKVTRDQTP